MPSTKYRALLALFVGFLVIGSPLGSAHAASDLERYLTAATRLYENLEYELALAQLQRARNVARGVEEDVTVALYEGIILADLNRWEQARASFLMALMLKPDAKLPLRVSPKVEREFEAQRERALRQLAHQRPAPQPEPTVPPTSTPPAVASDRPEQKPARESRLIPEPAPAPAPVAVTGVEAPARGVPTLPLVLLGAGVVAAGSGTWFGLASRNQVESAWNAHFQSDVVSNQREAQRSARTANLLFGTAGLAVAGAVVSWLLTPADAAPASEETKR